MKNKYLELLNNVNDLDSLLLLHDIMKESKILSIEEINRAFEQKILDCLELNLNNYLKNKNDKLYFKTYSTFRQEFKDFYNNIYNDYFNILLEKNFSGTNEYLNLIILSLIEECKKENKKMDINNINFSKLVSNKVILDMLKENKILKEENLFDSSINIFFNSLKAQTFKIYQINHFLKEYNLKDIEQIDNIKDYKGNNIFHHMVKNNPHYLNKLAKNKPDYLKEKLSLLNNYGKNSVDVFIKNYNFQNPTLLSVELIEIMNNVGLTKETEYVISTDDLSNGTVYINSFFNTAKVNKENAPLLIKLKNLKVKFDISNIISSSNYSYAFDHMKEFFLNKLKVEESINILEPEDLLLCLSFKKIKRRNEDSISKIEIFTKELIKKGCDENKIFNNFLNKYNISLIEDILPELVDYIKISFQKNNLNIFLENKVKDDNNIIKRRI